MEIAVWIGKALAMCAHPHAAWRAHSTNGRLFVLAAYALGSYLVVLGLLQLTL